jgi:hypothetical protein
VNSATSAAQTSPDRTKEGRGEGRPLLPLMPIPEGESENGEGEIGEGEGESEKHQPPASSAQRSPMLSSPLCPTALTVPGPASPLRPHPCPSSLRRFQFGRDGSGVFTSDLERRTSGFGGGWAASRGRRDRSEGGAPRSAQRTCAWMAQGAGQEPQRLDGVTG